MWTILESERVRKQIKKCPKEIIKQYEAWKKIVEHGGTQTLRTVPGYHDHLLKGEWAGARSSYLTIKWRVIYVVFKKQIHIKILEVNAHDYG